MERLIRLASKSALLTVLTMSSSAFAADAIALKNFREIFSSYESITGVSGRSDDLRDLYRLNVDRLPKYGMPGELSSPTVLAMTELGGTFCKKAIDREKTQSYGERILFYDLDFARGPNQFTSYLREILAEHMATAFWQRNITMEEKAAISNLIMNTARGLPDAAVETEKVALVVCATYASSMGFLVK